MKAEYDFSQGERGKFFRPNAIFHLPTNDQSAQPTHHRETQQPKTATFALNSYATSGVAVAPA